MKHGKKKAGGTANGRRGMHGHDKGGKGGGMGGGKGGGYKK